MNGALRKTYRGVTFPFSAVIRMMDQLAREVILAVRRLGAGIIAYVSSIIQAVGYGIWIVISFPIWVLNGIVAGIRWAYHVVRSAIASVYRSMVFGLIRVWHGIIGGAMFIVRAPGRFMVWSLHAITAAAFMPFRLAVVFIGARYRSFVFNASATSMTLSMEDGHARLLVLKRDKIIAWRSGDIEAPPELSSAVSEDVELSEDAPNAPIFSPLGPILDGLPARSKRVVADLPLHVPLLRHIPLPDVKGKFLKEIVNTEVLNSVPFAQDEVDIQWRIEQGEGIREASVIAIPRARMDDQIKVLRNSQLAPAAVYSKAASLAVAVARPDVFILHMTKGQTAVILVRKGVTRIVHRIELPRDLDEQIEAIAMGVGQVAGYHRSQRPDDDVDGLPIVVTGELDPVKELVGQLEQSLDRQVLPFEPALECPKGFDPAQFASNIGLHLVSHLKKSKRVIAAQNVLPERHRPRPLPVVPTAVFTVLLLFAFLAFNLAGWVSDISAELGPLNAKLDIREEQNRDYRLAVARQNVVGQRIVDADEEALSLLDNLDSFEQEMGILLSRLNDITGNAALSNVDLTRLVPIPEGFSVSGSAIGYPDVLEYAALMRDSPNFHDATVLQVADSTGSTLGFTVVITVSAPEGDENDGAQSPGQRP